MKILSPRVARVLIGEMRIDSDTMFDAIDALDELDFSLRRWPHRADLTPALDAARSAIGAIEPEFVKELIDPPLGPLPRSVDQLSIRPFETTRVPWPATPGRIVALARRGRMEFVPTGRLPGELTLGGYGAHVHVASGNPRTPRLDVLEAALVAIEAAFPSREDHEQLLRLIDECERDDPRANSEASVRFAVSCIERAKAIPKAREGAVAFLARAGITPLALAAGEKFDPERHPASAFERKLVRGPAGKVVATEATGWKDARGVVLARAVVTVGES